jgi:hypothetical protein
MHQSAGNGEANQCRKQVRKERNGMIQANNSDQKGADRRIQANVELRVIH